MRKPNLHTYVDKHAVIGSMLFVHYFFYIREPPVIRNRQKYGLEGAWPPVMIPL